MSGERTPTGADCDLGTVAFVDACGSKHVAQVVDPRTRSPKRSGGAWQRNSTYICDPSGCEFDDAIEWMNRKIADAETILEQRREAAFERSAALPGSTAALTKQMADDLRKQLREAANPKTDP